MRRGRERIAGDDQRRAAVGSEVARSGFDPLDDIGPQASGRRDSGDADSSGKRLGDRAGLRGPDAEAVISDRTGGRRARLGDVKTIHLRLAMPDLAAIGELGLHVVPEHHRVIG